MKKLLLFVTLLVYFLVSTSFVISMHYCMDRMHSLQFGDSHQKACGICGMPFKDNKGCCKDKVKIVKLQVDQVTVQGHSTILQVPIRYLSASFLKFLQPLESRSGFATMPPPPLLNGQYRYLYHCVFRI